MMVHRPLLVVCALVVLAAPVVPATAHPHEHAPEPDPDVRTLYLVGTNETKDVHSEPGQVHTQEFKGGTFALSEDANSSARSSAVYTWRSGGLCGLTFPCYNQPYKASAEHAGEDFELQPMYQVAGVLHLAWSMHASTPVHMSSGTAAIVQVGLSIGGNSYSGESFHLSKSGDASFPLMFTIQHPCESSGHKGHGNNTSACDGQAEFAEAWAHDISLWFTIQPYKEGYPSALFEKQGTVKIDAMGGSALEVLAVPPPPPPAEEVAEPVAAEEAVVVEWEDSDGDGEREIYVLPFPGLGVLIAAIAGAAFVRRARNKN